MIVSFLILLLATGGLEPGAELAEHACGHVEVGGAQSCREPVHPGRLLLGDRLVPGAATLGQVAAMVGAVSRWVPVLSSPSTNWATSARLMESRMVTGRRG